jgi:hypothetical protein
LMDFKCESRSIDTPYTADVLEQCILVKDSVDLACDSFKVQCKLCPKKYVKKKMRNHIGYHIIHGDCSPNSHRCGYCGEIGCQISLVVTSGCGKRVVYGPKSDCNYFTEISKRLDNRFVKSYPIDPFCVNNVKAIIGHTTWTCTSNNFMLAFNALSKYLKKREFLLYLLKRCD